MNRIIQIEDHSGFIGIVNNDKYNSYIREDWKLEELLERFNSETNNTNCMIWGTGTQDFFTIDFRDERSVKESIREEVVNISVTNKRLFVTNYEDLTMAAQYADEGIPSKHNADKFIELQNGHYSFIIRQMFESSNYDIDNPPSPFYEIVITRLNHLQKNNFHKVIWWEY